MTEQPMQDELVERVARAIRLSDRNGIFDDWDEIKETTKGIYRPRAQAAIAIMQQDLAARNAEVATLKLDLEVQECLQDSAYQAGMKLGWNCAICDDQVTYGAAMKSTEHVRRLREIRSERAALKGLCDVG